MGAIEAIQSVYLEANASVVTFDINSSPGNTYEHLQLRGTLIQAHPFGASDFTVNLAAGGGSVDTANNYSYVAMSGDGTSASVPVRGINARQKFYSSSTTGNGQDASSYTGFVMDILDYRSTTKNTTTMLTISFPDDPAVFFNAGSWNNTGAVTTVQIEGSHADIVRGSSFNLYGLKSS